MIDAQVLAGMAAAAGAAVCFDGAVILQAQEARRFEPEHALRPSLLVRLARRPRWVVGTVRQWLSRGDGVRRTVRLELGGDVLELSQASAAEQQRLIELFVRRHDPRDDGDGR